MERKSEEPRAKEQDQSEEPWAEEQEQGAWKIVCNFWNKVAYRIREE